jgi:hypothetical protein
MTGVVEDVPGASDMGKSRSRTGVVASILRIDGGFRLILDDVVTVELHATSAWLPVRLFTHRDLVETRPSKVPKDKLAAVGAMLLARLHALQTTDASRPEPTKRARVRKAGKSKKG